ncbi:MAG: hypothetical protein QXV17_06495 [Candidatus Micrarchaeaceae archaeon]
MVNMNGEKKVTPQWVWYTMEPWEVAAVIDACRREGDEKKDGNEILQDLIDELFDEVKNYEKDSLIVANSFADGYTQTYTSDLLRWYAEDSRRADLADQGIEEYGTDGGLFGILQRGQYILLERFAETVLTRAGEIRLE